MLDFIRGIVRPVSTLLMVIASIIMVFFGVDVPEWFRNILLMVMGFYFGSRGNKTTDKPDTK